MPRARTLPAALLAVLLAACACPPPGADDPAIQALAVKNARSPMPGVLTAGQPDEAQFEALADAGYDTFVNMRLDGEEGTGWEARRAEELGVRYVHIPVGGPDDLTEANARALDAALKSGNGVVVYCGSSNRVGALLGLKAHVVDGKPAAEALEVAHAAGVTRMEPALREKLGLPPQ